MSKIVSVTWVDGKTETYACDDWSMIDGVLIMTRKDSWQPKFFVPYDVNVRVWSMHESDEKQPL